MRRWIDYGFVFVVLVLLQIFLFDNLNISIYVYPIIYIGFIIILPMNINSALLLFLGFLTGLVVDFFSGTYGLNTIACVATCFVRPAVLNLTIGKDAARDGGMLLPLSVGRAKWFRYALILVLVHCLVFFFFEAMTFRYIWFTLARTACSVVLTTVLIWFLAYLFPYGKQNSVSLR